MLQWAAHQDTQSTVKKIINIMIMNIIIPIENGRLIQIISITLQRLQGAGHIWKIIIVCKFVIPNRLLWGSRQIWMIIIFANLLSQTTIFARSPSIWMIIIIYKFAIPNRPLCGEPSNLDDRYHLQISCPKPPSLQGSGQFQWSR